MALGDGIHHSWSIDETRFPLVVTTFGTEFRDDADVRGMTQAADALFSRPSRWVHVLDLRAIVRPANAAQRKIMGDWFRGVKERNANARVLATAVLVESTLVRGAMTAVLWLTTPTGERIEVFKTPEEALPWLKKVADEHGLTLRDLR